ncbi:uncharacterized protein LOC122639450 [Telopea speciosissima]|uniref:uncharacterized protein LOC122639450 n=1 Tax=Telopea speciosissima TaxID=54955 RepID=UPI001CC730DB|nr:uncharacterized protein LOC122639450 [Telopea speciosissima]
MAKRRAKKNVPKASTTLASNLNDAHEQPKAEMPEDALRDHEVERQIAATRAIRDLETECLLTGLRLLRSNFSEEKLQTPVLQFFKENLPNLSLVRNNKDGQFEVELKDEDGNLFMSHTDERNIHTSILQRMSMSYHPDFAGVIPNFGGFEFSSKSVKTNPFDSANLQIPDYVLEEQSDTQMLGLQEAFRTPGVSTHRLSVGMTPKTRRLPKHGEMILSVHGSPLGVYKEGNMEAINGMCSFYLMKMIFKSWSCFNS